MFPLLFNKSNVNNFHCKVCQLAKHHRVSFPLSNIKSVFPFLLIHTNVWSPSRIPSFFGAMPQCGLHPLSMIVLGWIDYTSWKTNQMLVLCFLSFTKWLTHGLGLKWKPLDPIIEKNTLIRCHLLFLKNKGLYTNLHVLSPHSQMVWLNGKMNIY